MNTPRFSFLFAGIGTLTLLITSAASADCQAGGLRALPARGTAIMPQSALVISGFGTRQSDIVAFASRRPVLVKGRKRIPLKVLETHRGSFNSTQAVVRPVQPLSNGTWELMYFDAGRLIRRSHLKWTVREFPRPTPVSWTKPPAVLSTARHPMGCGPDISVTLDSPTHGEIGVLVEVKTTSGTARQYVGARDGKLAVGHGMCTGDFDWKTGEPMTISIIGALDETGALISSEGTLAAAPIRLTAP